MVTTSKPKIAKTGEELKKEFEKTKKKLAELEHKIFADELGALIKNSTIVAQITEIQSKVKGATDTAILTAIVSAVGIKRIVISQTKAPTRKSYYKPKAAKKVTAKK
jgi:hypothetical protein